MRVLPAERIEIVTDYVAHETDAAIVQRLVDLAINVVAEIRCPLKVDGPERWAMVRRRQLGLRAAIAGKVAVLV